MKQPSLTERLKKIDILPDSMYVFHEKMEHRFPIHKHGKAQLTYVEGGIAYLNTKDKAYFLPARHYIWIPAGLEHFVQLRSPSLQVRNIYFCNEHDGEHPFFGQMGIYPVSNLLLEMIGFTEKWRGDVIPGTIPYQFLSTLKHILPEISVHPLPIVLPTTQNERMQEVIRYIYYHISEDLTLAGLAPKFGMSVRTFSRLFQSALNTSFFQYLKLSRIVRAMQLLLQSDKSISQIAYETGYNSISAFSNTFYQLVNMRPSDFQKLKS